MKKLTWWFRIVGGFYLLLALANFYAMFFTDGQSILAGSPFVVDELVIRVATDYWSSAAFGLFGTGTFLLWASRNALQHVNVARYVAWLEIFSGVGYVVYSLTRGYDAVGFGIFGVIHLIIIVTGFMFARDASAQ